MAGAMTHMPHMDGRICLVTGGTDGIGKAVVEQLAPLGAELVFLARDEQKAQTLCAQLKEQGYKVGYIKGCLDDRASVRALAEQIDACLPKLHVLIHCAAEIHRERLENADGLERTFFVNHLAPYLLTRLLLPKMIQSGTARIVNVGCTLYSRARIHPEDLQSTQYYDGVNVYARTKLCTLLFHRELVRRTRDLGLSVHCALLRPTQTTLGTKCGLVPDLVSALGHPVKQSPQKAAERIVTLAAAPKYGLETGRVLGQGLWTRLNAAAKDDLMAQKLWMESAALCGVEGELL